MLDEAIEDSGYSYDGRDEGDISLSTDEELAELETLTEVSNAEQIGETSTAPE